MADFDFPTGIPIGTEVTGETGGTYIWDGVKWYGAGSTLTTVAPPPIASSSLPAMDGVANPGVSGFYSQGDHVHPTDTSLVSLSGGTMTGPLALAAGSTTPQVLPATDSSPSVASTAFVQSAIAATRAPSNAAPVMDGVAAPGVSTLYARGDHVHPTDTSLAPLLSPALLGQPSGPTPSVGDNSTRLATTAFVAAGYLTLAAAASTYAPLNSPALVGQPTAPTAPLGDSSQLLANTAFVAANYLTPAEANTTYLTITNAEATYAPLVSPILQGYPQGPTAPPGTNTQQLATTAFVLANISGGGGAGPIPPQTLLGNNTSGTTTAAALTAAQAKALLAIGAADVAPGAFPTGAYTFNGAVTVGAGSVGVTPLPGDSSTKLATTAFVASSFLTSANAASTYLTIANAASTYAPLNSPALVGQPSAPTPSVGDSSTRLATTAFVLANGASTPIASQTLLGNNTGSAATAFGLTPAQAKAVLAITPADVAPGTFVGNYTINGGLTVSGVAALGTGSTGVTPSVGDSTTKLATTAFVLTNGVNAPIPSQTLLGNNTGASASATALTAAQAKTLLAIAAPDVAPGAFGSGAYSFGGAVTIAGVTTLNGAATANAGLTASSLTGSTPTAVLDSFVIDCGTY